ncbi:MAG: hypothetical protein EOM21_21015 [Gammaproteobacteria bacterium]|nr:hypothetical protein [Gammaproteobacteria bacterium]
MKEIKEGVIYELSNFSSGTQTIRFTEKVESLFNDGTTNEEVVNMLIERFYTLQKKNYSTENAAILIMLKNVRRLLATRFKRKKENIERYEENNNSYR